MLIYPPAEDSYFLSDILKNEIPELLKKNPDLTFLEIGAGSGIHLQTVLNLGVKKQNIFSSDMNIESVQHCNLLGFNCIKSDLFENINGNFDFIVFNPPYLPEDKYDKEKDTTGGKKGSEIINRFLKQAKAYIKKNGKIFLLTSSLAKDINFADYEKKLLGKEKLFFEELSVWELGLINYKLITFPSDERCAVS
mgnify:CR=1 FL=1